MPDLNNSLSGPTVREDCRMLIISRETVISSGHRMRVITSPVTRMAVNVSSRDVDLHFAMLKLIFLLFRDNVGAGLEARRD